VFDPRRAAAIAGVAVDVCDLGDWAGRLVSEYDPRARTIRVNGRALAAYRSRVAGETAGPDDIERFIVLAVAHELYHHREAIGEVARLATRAAREAAADAYARAAVPVGEQLAAFLERAAAS
jgi:hypothetical protein